MSTLESLHTMIGQELEIQKEIISKRYEIHFENSSDAVLSAENFMCSTINKNHKLLDRHNEEKYYHKYLENGMIANYGENGHATGQSILHSRRIVMTNHICISYLQILFRDKIYVDMHMRSSAYDSALPTDLYFVTKLVDNFLAAAQDSKWESQDIINNLRELPIQIGITFGSLHKIGE